MKRRYGKSLELAKQAQTICIERNGGLLLLVVLLGLLHRVAQARILTSLLQLRIGLLHRREPSRAAAALLTCLTRSAHLLSTGAAHLLSATSCSARGHFVST